MAYYFIYKITQGPTEMVKVLDKIDRFDNYKAAKQQVKQLRNDQAGDTAALFKIVFAESELQAEEMLQEKREKPIVEEWEK
jgi:hypothetical protein